jgi:putative transposase
MARPIRIQYPDAVYHVMARGNERKAIYTDDSDRQTFLKTLKQAVEQFGLVVHAYCLMTNHYHALVQTPRGNLSQAIGWLQTTYTIRFNRRHWRSGHLFQGRYKALLVEAQDYAQVLIRYIHLNPLSLKGVSRTLEGLDRYRWSSHRVFSGVEKKTAWFSDEWLVYWAQNKSSARKAYREDVLTWLEQKPVQPLSEVKHGLILGGEQLLEKVKGLLKKANGTEEERWKKRMGQEELAERVEYLARDEHDKTARIWLRVRLGGKRPKEVAEAEGYRDTSGVTQVIKRLEAKAGRDKRLRMKLEAYRKELSIVKS